MFKPGQSGNINGRPKGTENKISKGLREILLVWIEGKLPELNLLWNELKPREKKDMIVEILPYTVSRLKSNETTLTIDEAPQSLKIEMVSTGNKIAQSEKEIEL